MPTEAEVAARLMRHLGLSKVPSKETMKRFTVRTRELQEQIIDEVGTDNVDVAAMFAAKEIFGGDFTSYGGRVDG